MLFYEKMNLLMNLLEISNSTLARHLSLDPSYISRMRRGLRNPAFESTYFDEMVDYFLMRIDKSTQNQSIHRMIGLHEPLSSHEKTDQLLLFRWLTERTQKVPVENLLDEVSNFNFSEKSVSLKIDIDLPEDCQVKNGQILYGHSGKRAGVKLFLTRVLKASKPKQIYLLSEENMDWLTSDPVFMQQWSVLLAEVVKRGHKITIIHNINRRFDEMMVAIRKWLPIYMTGAISPYYYPKMRDRVFKKTLFIAEEDMALVADTVGEYNENQANILYTDHEMVAALKNEFDYYLKLCRPLMKIFTSRQWEKAQALVYEFQQETASGIFKSDALSPMTLPMNLLDDYLEQGLINQDIYKRYRKEQALFIENIKQAPLIEIIVLPDIKNIQDNKVFIQGLHWPLKERISYDLKSFREHLKCILRFQENYDSFQVLVSTQRNDSGYSIYVKDDVGTMIHKNKNESTIFAINEKNMTLAFWDYLSNSRQTLNDQKTSRRLINDYIEGLDQLISLK